jgi:ribosomal protein L15E
MQAKHNAIRPDPRLSRLVQQLDLERRGRIAAERKARALRLALRRVLASRKAAAKPEAQTSAG